MPTLLNTDTPPHGEGYMLLFRGRPWYTAGYSDEELQGIMEEVNAWFAKLNNEGKLVGGRPLFDRAVTVTSESTRSVTDGPYPEAKEAIGGYISVNAGSFEEAVEIARENPMTKYGLITEVREIASDCPHMYQVRQRLGTAAVA
jgi:hypothetical protein